MPTTILDGETYEQARHRRFTEEAKVIEKVQQDEIIRMAWEAGLDHYLTVRDFPKQLESFAALVAAHEREACAKVCEEKRIQMNYSEAPYNQCAEAIRARGGNGS